MDFTNIFSDLPKDGITQFYNNPSPKLLLVHFYKISEIYKNKPTNSLIVFIYSVARDEKVSNMFRFLYKKTITLISILPPIKCQTNLNQFNKLKNNCPIELIEICHQLISTEYFDDRIKMMLENADFLLNYPDFMKDMILVVFFGFITTQGHIIRLLKTIFKIFLSIKESIDNIRPYTINKEYVQFLIKN